MLLGIHNNLLPAILVKLLAKNLIVVRRRNFSGRQVSQLRHQRSWPDTCKIFRDGACETSKPFSQAWRASFKSASLSGHRSCCQPVPTFGISFCQCDGKRFFSEATQNADQSSSESSCLAFDDDFTFDRLALVQAQTPVILEKIRRLELGHGQHMGGERTAN